MAQGPKISVIMPVLNAEKHIKDALSNVTEQIFQGFEIIILDSLSTDATVSIVKNQISDNSRIRLISEKDQGIYDAMNKGIAMAKGEWIYFMGSDDAFNDSEVLRRVVPFLDDNVDIVYGDSLWVPDGKIEEGECELRQLINRNINHQRIFYRKSLFLDWGNYKLKYKIASDYELNIRFFCNLKIRKSYIPTLIAKYHSGGFSAHKTDEVFWDNWKKIYRQNFARHLPARDMYIKLGWYCRHQIDRNKYAKSFLIFLDVLMNTLSPGFVLLTLRHVIKVYRRHES